MTLAVDQVLFWIGYAILLYLCWSQR